MILLARAGRDEEAVELWAAVRGIDERHPSYGAQAERIGAALTAARASLGVRFDDAELRGRRRVGLDAVSTLALSLCEQESAHTARS